MLVTSTLRGETMATATALPKRSEVRVEDTWNLEAIYLSVEAWEADFQRVTGMLEGIRAGQGALGDSAQALLQALQRRDEAGELLGRLYVFAHMRFHQDTAESQYQALADRVTTLASEMNAAGSYMTPEILTIPQEKVDGFLAEEPKLTLYRHALDEINRERPHILSAEME